MKRWRTAAVILTGALLPVCSPDHHIEAVETVAFSIEIEGSGTVDGCAADTAVTRGDTLRLTATANSGAVFSGWWIEGLYTGNPLVLAVQKATTVRALFKPAPRQKMARINARDSMFLMGSSTDDNPAIEQPQHPVRFTYDFYMGTREVTRGEYASPAAAGGAGTSGDSLPVCNVSWYDAVRYCNMLSKREGYDTVYTYTAVCPTPGACPYLLENLNIHYDRFGYRLPTEAEWEYACRAGSDTRYFWGNDEMQADSFAWYFNNAENRLHPVGGKLPNGYGLYDMAGNAAEWVNDWLGYYRDSAVSDPVGPQHLTLEQFEATYERPLRGGSYRLSASALRSGWRKGPYEMGFAATQIDVGFRVALGAFAAPAAPVATGTPPQQLSAVIVANKSDLIAKIGTHRIKLAFVYTTGRRKLCALVDFNASPVTIVGCGDDTTVSAPMISPDGKYIAYGSKDEGSSGSSMITVRSLSDTVFPVTARLPGFLPRWWVDPQSGATSLIYCTGASLNDQPQWYTEKTLRHRIDGGIPQGDPEVLWDSGSYHGGLSSDGRFLGTAYPRAKLVDLRLADTNIFYFVPPWNGRTDTPQVCNLSMSPSKKDPGTALFLDFGYPEVSTLVGRPYGIHEILFIANTRLFSNEHITAWFDAPQGYDRWNFTEWTNYAGAVAAVAQTEREGDDDAVVLLNCRDSSVCTVLRGSNLRDVTAWIDPSDVSEGEDPYVRFGAYDIPIQTQGQVVLAKKMRLFWHEREHAACIVMGNSPTMFGFDPHGVTVLPTLNVAWFQSSLGTSVAVALNYILTHSPELKVLIIDLDASYLAVDVHTAIPRMTGLYDSEGYELDSMNGFYRNGLPGEVIDKAAAFDDASWSGFDRSGAFVDSMIGEGWGEPIIEGTDYSIDDPVVRENLEGLAAVADSAFARGIRVVAVNYPQNPGYRNTEMAGRAGPSRSTYLQLVEILRTMEEQHPNFHFYDANNLGDHDYTDSEAFDTNHLNARGGKKLAARVDSLLQIIIK